MIYAADTSTTWIMHVHSPAIWEAAAQLQLPTTASSVAYGSPAMATAVAETMRANPSRPLLFATLGHTDGVFACGDDADAVGALLTRTLAAAQAVNQP
jgi:hypothetical protein